MFKGESYQISLLCTYKDSSSKKDHPYVFFLSSHDQSPFLVSLLVWFVSGFGSFQEIPALLLWSSMEILAISFCIVQGSAGISSAGVLAP